MFLRISLIILFLLILTGAAAWVAGPREPVDLTITFDPAVIGSDPDAYLARTEANIANLRPADAKEIVWAYPASRAKTPLAIVYVHGFSASKEEIRPVPDDVAQHLGANLFFARLSGHGRDGTALGRTNVNEWLNDLTEAVAIGRMIGERVIVVATSTGGTLATLGATRPGVMDDVAGMVLVSPNYRLLDRYAFALELPFAREIGPRLMGEERSFEPVNAAQAAHWTTRYPLVALLPMGALIRAVRSLDVGKIAIPALFLVSPQDKIVDPAATEAVAARWGAPQRLIQVPVTGDPNHHVLAGRVLSPATSDEITSRIIDWIGALPGGASAK
ncbi:lysophospholipase [Aureimonas sp. SA4125]|uniref:alpha/beta hydrolase n=1 Tax=Aureimonas sp. SA4125 TaxID=2826993 RepID=UPI001CC64E3A|nr:alpha/beta fold hydrolase [Aureimonas sp. SA4125]BDA84316.1 lysophospholipase [Aureimonas sp. SA4125]